MSGIGKTDSIKVFLRDCQVELRVGAYDYETKGPQPVVVNLEVEAALPQRYQDLASKDLSRVIDYAPFHDFVYTELPKMGHIPLLETVAEQIVSFCFRDERVRAVKIRLEKPKMFADTAGAGIEIYRSR